MLSRMVGNSLRSGTLHVAPGAITFLASRVKAIFPILLVSVPTYIIHSLKEFRK